MSPTCHLPAPSCRLRAVCLLLSYRLLIFCCPLSDPLQSPSGRLSSHSLPCPFVPCLFALLLASRLPLLVLPALEGALLAGRNNGVEEAGEGRWQGYGLSKSHSLARSPAHSPRLAWKSLQYILMVQCVLVGSTEGVRSLSKTRHGTLSKSISRRSAESLVEPLSGPPVVLPSGVYWDVCGMVSRAFRGRPRVLS